MKQFFFVLAVLCSIPLKATKDQSPVLETKHFRFYNNINLNTHLFLYKKAVRCKLRKTPADSIAIDATQQASMPLDAGEMELVKKTIVYYRDSLLSRDLLFDAEMNAFSDMLVKDDPGKEKMNAWQLHTWKKIKAFQALYLKIQGRQQNRDVADWIMNCKKDILAFEDTVMIQLQKIYADTLMEDKLRVDLTCYATWAGAYSYRNVYPHIVIDAGSKNNRKEAGVEVLFHEASHFMMKNLELALVKTTEGKKITKDLNLWHNLIFYTTAVVVGQRYTNTGRPFTPYYITQGFETKFPVFKTCTDAFKQYWDAYIRGELTMERALENIVNHILEHWR